MAWSLDTRSGSTTERRDSDSIFVVSGGEPESLKVVGRIGQIDDLQPDHQRPQQNPRTFDLADDDGKVVPTIIALLRARGCYTRLGLYPNPPEFDATPTRAAATLYAFSPRGGTADFRPGEILAVWGEEPRMSRSPWNFAGAALV